MGRHHSIFGDIKKAFNDAGKDIKHSPVINSVINDTKKVGNSVVSTVKDPEFQKGFEKGFVDGFTKTGAIVGPLAFPEVGLALEAASAAPSILGGLESAASSVTGGLTGGLSSITGGISDIMPYVPYIGAVVVVLVIYKSMKK